VCRSGAAAGYLAKRECVAKPRARRSAPWRVARTGRWEEVGPVCVTRAAGARRIAGARRC
jgi:hypothetical protein